MNKDIENFWAQLKTQRDELVARAYLAKAELKDEREALEIKWLEAEKKIHHLQDEAIETTQEMKYSAHIILEEIYTAYKRIKARLDN
jgi:hypothetical protein